MAQGTLKIQTTMAQEGLPVAGVGYAILDKSGNVLFEGVTNENGESGVYTLEAPPRELSLTPNPDIRPYAVYDVWVGKPGFATLNFIDVEIFDGIEAILPVNMLPLQEGTDEEQTIVIPPPTAQLPSYDNIGQVAPPDVPVTEPVPPGYGIPLVNFAAPRDIAVIANAAGMEMPLPTPSPLRGATPSPSEGEFSRIAPAQDVITPQPLTLPAVIMPDYVTVHLGTPANTGAPRVRVRFIDYVKNVTCSEIYPTWPVNSIIANVHCIVSFVLNRIYTEWYRSRGYNYDITNSTTVDQYFVNGRQIFQNISQIVDGIFNVYARRIGFRNPYFTEYCNGTTATCKGLSQWGTVTLANRGLTPLQILHNFYPRDLALFTAPSGNNIESFPGTLQTGSSGESVRRMQNRLNRIRANYPAIPLISNPNGVFGPETREAVRIFQRTFNLTQDGVVGRATWNKITQIFVAVTKLAELGGEGERIGLSPTAPTVTIRQGSRGADVIHAQFLLNYISQFYADIPSVIQDSIFGATTTEAVRAFQRRFGITADGVVGPNTWRKLYEVASGIIGQQPPEQPRPPITPPTPPSCPPYPGFLLRLGSRGDAVRNLQTLLNGARAKYSAVPAVAVDGIFGPLTAASVRTFQLYAGLAVDGIVGPLTWRALTDIVCGP